MKPLVLEQLTKIFESGEAPVVAVDKVSLEVSFGELLVIMGPSGSGKTTLLSMMGGLLKPTSGKVFLLGKDLSTLNDDSLSQLRREAIGFVFQTFNLFSSLTVLENVLVPLHLRGIKGKPAQEKALQLLKTLGLENRKDFYPADLSGGQKQRVSIARALANDPLILLADEPTGMLDSRTGLSVMTLLRSLADQGKAVVVVTHDPRAVHLADRVLHLEDGHLVDQLTPH